MVELTTLPNLRQHIVYPIITVRVRPHGHNWKVEMTVAEKNWMKQACSPRSAGAYRED
ncbi:hypothetical protein [Sporolituus thermophilus]|uniref:Uncharacterized protein n=1 Tax=Sporolituus thermophilus DSM 23256 TaxID=1123285 RepID=A0A1G7NP59_9FIRM|nr:hypothetical protein [Sporolituus thermophilus]SDF75763.1 hypothetical protein SAMN05660235_02642 [Sporolituus thermophilus DSM 23256]